MSYSKKSKFEHHRQKSPGEFEEESFRNVPISHVPHKYATQSILIPKRKQRQRKTRIQTRR